MLTQFGIFLRKLRLNHNEIMKDMAAKLNISPSFLSAVERGKKKIPESWYNQIVNLYDLDKEKQNKLKKAIEDSQKILEINLENLSTEQKRLAFAFTKELKNMNKEDIKKINILLKKKINK